MLRWLSLVLACTLDDPAACATQRDCLMLSERAHWTDGHCGVCADENTLYFVEQQQCVATPAQNAFLDKRAHTYRCPTRSTLVDGVCACPLTLVLQLDGKACASECGPNQGNSNGVCACVNNYVASLDASACVETSACAALGGIDTNGRCACSEGHVQDLTH